eukprot:3611032-Amphidinium_carterae.1
MVVQLVSMRVAPLRKVCQGKARMPGIVPFVGQRMLSSAASSTTAPRILRSGAGDILFRFAVEEYLTMHAPLTAPVLYLWRPTPVLAIGRHQNPWKECIMSKLEEDGVALVRRRSGGGAIYMDPGNTVFTILGPSGQFSIDTNFDVILGALRRCGIEAERSGRNDITVEGKKVSGSAFKHSPDRGMSLHHGTLLVNADMQAIQKYLTPDKRKLEAKGIASVGARVLNMKDRFPDLSHESLCEALIEEYKHVMQVPSSVEVEDVEGSPLSKEPVLNSIFAELSSDDWRLGRTPEFSHQLETRIDGLGVLDVRMQVVGGRVEDVIIYSDALFPDVIDHAMLALKGQSYGRQGLRQALEGLRGNFEAEEPKLKLLLGLTDWL